MKQRQLGAGGPMIGAVGLGCMSFAGFYGPATQDDADAVLARAAELGITHLDTANVYGNGRSEEMMGRYFGGKPGNFTIATKAAVSRDADGNRSFCNEADYVRAELEGSLTRLGLDRVDLFYMHRREQARPVEEVMEHLLGLVEEGLIGGIGFSEISPATLRRACAIGPVRAVQSEYSLWSRMPELGMIEACADLGTAFVPFSPVARGMFGTEPLDPTTFSKGDLRGTNPRFLEPNFGFNTAIIKAFKTYAASIDLAPATLAMAWVLDQGSHLIPIPGTKSVAHLEELAAADQVVLTDEIRAEIGRLLPPGFAHGDRYSDAQIIGIERYC